MSELNASNLRKEHGNEGPDLVGTTELTSQYFMVPPSGTTAQRPENPQPGTLRFNTDIGSLEFYRGESLGWESINRYSPNLGGGTGSNGQYLKTVGTGVTWASFPTLRTRQTFTASAGQTTFSIAYTVNFLDVYVNGIKLTDSEFTATNGTQVVLAVGCFVGDIVELVAFSTISTGSGGGCSLNNIV